jgi:hypothetical protein
MTYAVEQVTAHRTSDLELFTDQGEAKRHQAELDLRAWARKASIGKGGDWTADAVINAILDDAENFERLLNSWLFNPAPGDPT